MSRRPPPAERIPPAEAVLLPLAAEFPATVAACNTGGRAQFAAALAAAQPGAAVSCSFWDRHLLQRTQAALNPAPPNLALRCEPDLPDGPADLVALALPARGENDFARDLLQQAAFRLRPGGRLLVGTDNPRDTWLHAELRERFDKVSRRKARDGAAYVVLQTAPPAKAKDYDGEFAFRDGERLVRAFSRPGVFAHRRMDGGARALLSALDVRPGATVLDLGCGSGAVAIAAALRADGVKAVGIDSNPRAVQCLERGAAANGVAARVRALLDADGSHVDARAFDWVLANPPYFSNFKIAELFLEIAAKALRPRGRVVAATKTPDWFAERMPKLFDAVAVAQHKGYWLVSGRR